MATVPFQDRLALTHPLTGITVGVYPSSDPFYDIQIYRAASTKSGAGPTSVPASSKFSELATLGVINGQASVTYRDSLPLSNTLWWYKARSVKTNVATPSAFTTAVYSQAGLMPTSTPGAIPWGGRPVNVGLKFTTVAQLNVVSSSWGTGKLTKTIRFPAAMMSPGKSGGKFILGSSGTAVPVLDPGTSSGSQEFLLPYLMPRGATVTAWRFQYARFKPGGTATFRLAKVSSSGGYSILKSISATTSAFRSTGTSTVSYTYTTGGGYLLADISLQRAAGLLNLVGLYWTELDYYISRYDHSH